MLSLMIYSRSTKLLLLLYRTRGYTIKLWCCYLRTNLKLHIMPAKLMLRLWLQRLFKFCGLARWKKSTETAWWLEIWVLSSVSLLHGIQEYSGRGRWVGVRNLWDSYKPGDRNSLGLPLLRAQTVNGCLEWSWISSTLIPQVWLCRRPDLEQYFTTKETVQHMVLVLLIKWSKGLSITLVRSGRY